jgi:hypothetical protein
MTLPLRISDISLASIVSAGSMVVVDTSGFTRRTPIGALSSGLGIINVKDPIFGAVGDGVTDDGAAITAAIAATPTNQGTVYFPRGNYAYATSPNFAKQGLSIIAESGTIFTHTGSGNAFNCDAGANPAFVNAMRLENIQVQGNANSTNTIYMRGIGRSVFKNIYATGGKTNGAALRCDFCLLNTWENFKATNQAPCPLYGIYLTRRDVGENTTTQTFINPIIEGMATASNAGIFIEWAATNTFIGGSSESNLTGLKISGDGPGFNVFVGTDLESNSTQDIDLQGKKNSFYGLLSLGTINGSTASCSLNTFIGGELTNVTLTVDVANTSFVNVNITGSFTDNSTSTSTTITKDMIATGRVRSSKASAAGPMTAANSSLMLYDSTLGAGLFGQQNSASPFDYWLQAASSAMSPFPLHFNPLGGLLKLGSVENGLTAHAGGGQANALQLSITATSHRVSTVASGADSVKLPAAVPGLIQYVFNSGANAMQVFGQSTETINDVASGTGVSVPAAKGAMFVCIATGAWYMVLGA